MMLIMTKFEKAIQDMDTMIESYVWTHDKDKGMLAMYKSDRKDFGDIVNFMKAQDWKSAFEKAQYMDTAARDAIPINAYQFMLDMYDSFVEEIGRK
jgi:hypothetical protein